MQITTRNDHGTCNVVLSGQFTFSDNAEFRTILDKIGDMAIKHLVFDMAKVDFVDSAALGMLLLAHDEAKKYNKSLLLAGVQGQVKRVFDMALFDKIFSYS